MPDQFDRVIANVRAKFAELRASPKHRIANLPKQVAGPGIYLFSETGGALYVGRTNDVRSRLQYHVRNNHNQAPFAFLLARRETGKLKASYKAEGSRKALLQDPEFRTAFDAARARIRDMDVQFVEESDPINQTILEVYAALKLKAQFNDFNNH